MAKSSARPRRFRSMPVFDSALHPHAAVPLGGIGTGCVSLDARGSLADWEIFNRPNKGSILPHTFATLWCRAGDGPAQCRVVQGPPNRDFAGSPSETTYTGYGFGMTRNQGGGLPCFAQARMHGGFPFADIAFTQPGFPLEVSLRAFNPFIPLDHDASGMPVACLVYRLTNPGAAPVSAALAFNLHNAVGYAGGGSFTSDDQDLALNQFRQGTHCRGLFMTNERYGPADPRHGTMALSTDWPDVTVLPHWPRPPQYGWYDAMHHFWDVFSPAGKVAPTADAAPGRNTAGTLALTATIGPGETVELPVLVSWCFPIHSKYWREGSLQAMPDPAPQWTNAYAKRHPTAWHAAEDFFAHRAELTGRTEAFADALLNSTLPREVVQSLAMTASILHSPTCLQYEDGTFWAWEGCGPNTGCCEGSCTHVWNYALTQAYLFPALHRSMRRSEYQYGFEAGPEGEKGAIMFRIALPLGAPRKTFHPAADGQLGGVVQLYRDWQLSGDEQYLKFMWPHAKRALEYAWVKWDCDRDGLIDGDQHNTYDINFQGPNPLMQFFYLAALTAGEKIARHLGDAAAADEYRRLIDAGRQKTQRQLFNGEFYVQTLDCLAAEAPKYQHGIGCLSDQVFGQLAAHVAGLGYLADEKQVKTALAAVFAHNFRDPLGDHANMQRIYAVGDEAGLLLCSWPRGGRPRFPFPYSDEVWTGIEYQVATHLIYEGLVEEGLRIIRGIRARHDGTRRNPFNEFECGSHYARALASWGLLLALTGFRYDAVDQTLHLTPQLPLSESDTAQKENLRFFFSTGSAWGTITHRGGKLTIAVLEGELSVRQVVTPWGQWTIDAAKQNIRGGKRLTLPPE